MTWCQLGECIALTYAAYRPPAMPATFRAGSTLELIPRAFTGGIWFRDYLSAPFVVEVTLWCAGGHSTLLTIAEDAPTMR